MKKALYTFIALLTFSIATQAQNVGVNTDGSTPDGDAILHIKNDATSGKDSTVLRIENEKNNANTVTGLELYNSSTAVNSRWSLYNPGLGSTDFRINNNGNDYMTILNSGNVGIGSTSPAYKLTIGGGASNSTEGLRINDPSNSAYGGHFSFSDTPNEIWIGGITNNVYNSAIGINRDATRAVTIDVNRRVGIGTTTPSANLDIEGTSDGEEFLRFSSDRSWSFINRGTGAGSSLNLVSNVNGKFFNIQSPDASNIAQFAASNTDADSRVNLVPDGGRVGIGTTTPSAELDVNGNFDMTASTTESRQFQIGNGRSGNGNSHIDLVGDATFTDYGLRIQRNNGGPNGRSNIYHRGAGILDMRAVDAGSINIRTNTGSVNIQTNNTTRMAVTGIGRVGIGTIAPTDLLTVNGTAGYNATANMGTSDTDFASKKYVDDKTSHTKTITIERPTNSEDITIFRTDVAITVQEVIAVRTGTGATNFRLRHSTNRAAAGTLVTNNLNSNSTTVGNIAPLGDSTIPANSWIWLETIGANGTNVTFTVDLRYTVD